MSKSALVLRIGSDAEFGFKSMDGCQIPASGITGRVMNVGGILDGHPDIMEIQTGRGDDCPLKHIKRMKHILNTVVRRIDYFKNPVKVLAGSMIENDPLGGHIHFAIKGETGLNFADQLDLFLAVPILMIANKGTFQLRPKNLDNYGVYGKLSDVRPGNSTNPNYQKVHGGFEYRTIPSWLVSESIATSILCLAYVVGNQIYLGDKSVPKFSDLGKDAVSNYYEGNRNFFSSSIPKIFSTVRKMESYSKYALPIASLFGLIKAFNEIKKPKNWREEVCLVSRWGITEELINGKHSITFNKNDSRLAELLEPFNEKKFDRSIKVYVLPKYTKNTIIVHPEIPRGHFMCQLLTKSDNFELLIGLQSKLLSTKKSIQETRVNIGRIFEGWKVKVTEDRGKSNSKEERTQIFTNTNLDGSGVTTSLNMNRLYRWDNLRISPE